MKMTVKYVVLILAFVLPALIFLFLKKFGKNRFEVSPLYTDGVPVRNTGCPPLPPGPYHIPDSILTFFGAGRSARLMLFSLPTGEPSNQQDRIMNAFKKRELELVNMVADEKFSAWNDCFLFIPEQKNSLLVDTVGAIRGYYNLASREDVDKLLMEAAIILHKY